MGLVQPELAPVRPRVICPESGEALPLEEIVQSYADRGEYGLIRLEGKSGFGKTTALKHLAAIFTPSAKVDFAEDPDEFACLWTNLTRQILVCTGHPNSSTPMLANYHLAPWEQDEIIEYLMAVHRDRCASVMSRLQPQINQIKTGNPHVWRSILDQMVNEPWITCPRMALKRAITRRLPDANLLDRIQRYCIDSFVQSDQKQRNPKNWLACLDADLLRLLKCPDVHMEMAVDHLICSLRNRQDCPFLAEPLMRGFIETAAPRIRQDVRTHKPLQQLLIYDGYHPMIASLLHLAQTEWIPENISNFAGAYLNDAAWPDIQLPDANFHQADLSNAYLCRAKLDGCNFTRAQLNGAQLNGASLVSARFLKAKLKGADLSAIQAKHADFQEAEMMNAVLDDAILTQCAFVSADLKCASLREANLRGAFMAGAKINDADFTNADLSQANMSGLRLHDAVFTCASFSWAELSNCDLEYMDFTEGNFEHANLEGALLTGCLMPEANLNKASLRNAGLAEINLEGADLRDADLKGASFHMGSSRSGMVFSPYPCEGSKTGFYTDDYEEQHFKSAEEIRKANLCRADLRGANLDHVDFYLVDLRDALYDTEREPMLRKSGAILEDW